jgi:RNA polymerase sigma-70 factor (ECF subfamily)
MGHAEPDPSADSDTSLDVTAALRKLPYDQRAALVLVDMLGYPVADAAEVLGVSQGTVKSRCARGRARLLPLLAHLRKGADEYGGRPGVPQHQASGPHSTGSQHSTGTQHGAAGQHAVSGQPGALGQPGAPDPSQARGNRSATENVLPAQEGGGPS